MKIEIEAKVIGIKGDTKQNVEAITEHVVRQMLERVKRELSSDYPVTLKVTSNAKDLPELSGNLKR